MATRKNAGFTIIEKLVSLSLVGILASIAAPSLLGFPARIALAQDANKLQNFLHEAQSEAKKTLQQSEFTLADCQGDSDCMQKEMVWQESSFCLALIQSLSPSNKLLWEMWQLNYLRVKKDGTCSLSTTIVASLIDSAHSVSEEHIHEPKND